MHVLINQILQSDLFFFYHLPVRKVTFPMGSYGAKTMKYTTILVCHQKKWFKHDGFPTVCVTNILHQLLRQWLHSPPRIWGNLPGLGKLRKPLDIKQLRAALERTGSLTGGLWRSTKHYCYNILLPAQVYHHLPRVGHWNAPKKICSVGVWFSLSIT